MAKDHHSAHKMYIKHNFTSCKSASRSPWTYCAAKCSTFYLFIISIATTFKFYLFNRMSAVSIFTIQYM